MIAKRKKSDFKRKELLRSISLNEPRVVDIPRKPVDELPPISNFLMWCLVLLIFWVEVFFALFAGWYLILDLPIVWWRFILGSFVISLWAKYFPFQIGTPLIERLHMYFLERQNRS